ncbi:MAG: zinc-ribbon domain-containing protein, partial [Gemmataceae bacterium]|nr:zinc-ribbon domain-containing protein [Gemmataceae bacterium]
MSIVAQCPHCETRFNLQAEMNGKSMRCPNFECRQVFTVCSLEAKGPAPPAPEPPPPKPPPSQTPKPSKPPKPTVVEAKVVEAKVVEAKVVEAKVAGPKEVVWSEGTDAPPAKKPPKPKKAAKVEVVEDAEPDPDFIVRRKKKSNRGPLILIGMGVVIAVAIGGVVLYIARFRDLSEEKLAAQAKEEYGRGDYGAAAKNYDKLAQEFSGSKKIDEYKFFADLA